MKITNETRYPTRTLRAIVCEAHRRLSATEGKLRTWDRLPVTVVYTRRAIASGWAWLSGGGIRLRLRRGTIPAAEVARLVDHELMHAYGHRHAAFCTGAGHWSAEHLARFEWAADVAGAAELHELEPAKAPVVSLDEKRAAALAHAEAKAAEWTRRAAIATKRARKWATRAKAITRRLALAASPDARR